jgi:hypothetical protein
MGSYRLVVLIVTFFLVVDVVVFTAGFFTAGLVTCAFRCNAKKLNKASVIKVFILFIKNN